MKYESIINSKIYKYLDFVYLLLFTNIIWIFFNLFGLIVLTIFPATVALYMVILNTHKGYEVNT